MAKVKTNMKTAKALRKPRRKNIIGNVKSVENRLWTSVAKGMKKFLSTAFPKK